jgi:hypothetical protein
LATVSRSMALALVRLSMDDDEVRAAKQAGTPPEIMVTAITKVLEQAYFAPCTEEISNAFAMHARTQAMAAIEFHFIKRKLKVPNDH